MDINDAHHRMLTALAGGLRRAVLAGSAPETITDLFERLLSYMAMHFAHEERLMMQNKFPDFEAHRRMHEMALQTIRKLDQAFRDGDTNAAAQASDFINDWESRHIPGSDAQLRDYFGRKS